MENRLERKKDINVDLGLGGPGLKDEPGKLPHQDRWDTLLSLHSWERHFRSQSLEYGGFGAYHFFWRARLQTTLDAHLGSFSP